MDIPGLQAFVAVADGGGFSTAGERLHLTQPAVSKRVAALEAALDCRLFDRLGRGVQLTEAGATLLPRARRILSEIEQSRRALAHLADHVGGTLALATSHHIGLHRLPPVLRRFTSRFREARLDLRFTDSELACEQVLAGEIELALITLPLQPRPPLLARPVWYDPLVVSCAPEHAFASAGRVSVADLATAPAILPAAGTFTRELLERHLAPLGVRLQVAFATNYLETIKMLVSVGLGWSLLPRGMVDASLVAVEVEGLSLGRRLGVVRHADHTPSSAARAMLELLDEEARGADAARQDPWRGY